MTTDHLPTPVAPPLGPRTVDESRAALAAPIADALEALDRLRGAWSLHEARFGREVDPFVRGAVERALGHRAA